MVGTPAARAAQTMSSRGFTLLEALIAAVILSTAVGAVTWAVTAGQQNAYEARERIGGAIAAHGLMSIILRSTFSEADAGWEEYQDVIEYGGVPFDVSVNVVQAMQQASVAGRDIEISGNTIEIQVVAAGHHVTSLTHFVPAPPE
jgi:prepilin-type N-terminal cleavage/methylation domain-containing protein